MVTRRSVLGGARLGLAGAAAGFVGGFYLGRAPLVAEMALMVSPLPGVEGIIDTHRHVLPPVFVKAIAELKTLCWDTALSFTEATLATLLTLTDPSKVVFGADFPFALKNVIPLGFKSLKANLGRMTLPASSTARLSG